MSTDELPDPMVYSEHVPVHDADSPVVHTAFENVDAFGGTVALDYHGGLEWSLRVPQRRAYLGTDGLRRLAERAFDQLGDRVGESLPPVSSTPWPPAADPTPPPYPLGGPQRALLTAGTVAPMFSDPLTPEQNARGFLLAQVVQLVGPDTAADAYVELVRFLETGLRSYDDPTPGPPSVDELERVRESIFGTLCRRGHEPATARDVTNEIVTDLYPGVAG